jgi:periplasmic divalent cation tolerance protein
MTPFCVVLCTCPDAAVAENIAKQLTDSRLVACTNIVPHLSSIYFWENKVTQGSEVLMVMKTRQDKLVDLENALVAIHPYKFPEFIALPIIYGNSKYLQWVDESILS